MWLKQLTEQELCVREVALRSELDAPKAESDMQLAEPNKIHFRFIGGTPWTLELLPRKECCLPFVCDPKGVWRRPAFSRFMRLQGSPQPEVAEHRRSKR